MKTIPSSLVPTMTRPAGRAFETTPRGRAISVAGAAYVVSWVTGLVLGPAAPAATASADEIHHYYATQGAGITTQSFLIHGIAGLALAVLAFTLPRATSASAPLSRAIKGAGVAAALTSQLQVAFAVVAVITASSSDPIASARLFDDLNLADTVKLTLIAVFAATAAVAASRASMIGSRTRALTMALVVALPIGGAAFVVDNAVLVAVLYVSLPLLLVWMAVMCWRVGLRAA